MGKRIRWREARRRETEIQVRAILEAHSRTDARPRAIERYCDFAAEYAAKIEALRVYALRKPEDWRCRIKSRAPERRFIDLVRFAFARYRVPVHLERAWLEEIDDDFVDRVVLPERTEVGRSGAPDLRRWHISAAQGGSLYKFGAHAYLSRQETHHFLTAPTEIASTKRAFWYAVARAQTGSTDVATRVASCKIANYSIASTYWNEVARFFARHALAVPAMDDLVDYLFVAKRADENFTLKGRTLRSLTRAMEDWHRMLRNMQTLGGGSWNGSPLPDIDYHVGAEPIVAIWRFRQIKTGNELVREGRRMHHCVADYKAYCMQGEASIWSLSAEFPIGSRNRGVTLEVNKDGRIVQCRGFANRLPYENEAAIAKQWAQDYGLTWETRER